MRSLSGHENEAGLRNLNGISGSVLSDEFPGEEGRGMRKRKAFYFTALLLVLAMVAAACGDDSETTTTAAAADDGEPASGPKGIIRFTFAPDPVWDYLQDSGIKDEMEQESGILILAAPTWNEFGVYAGGHADIGSVGSSRCRCW